MASRVAVVPRLNGHGIKLTDLVAELRERAYKNGHILMQPLTLEVGADDEGNLVLAAKCVNVLESDYRESILAAAPRG